MEVRDPKPQASNCKSAVVRGAKKYDFGLPQKKKIVLCYYSRSLYQALSNGTRTVALG